MNNVTITPDFSCYTKVVGVTQKNEDGEPIQSILSNLSAEDYSEDIYLQFLRDMFNPHDVNAIMVYADDKHIGYLSRELAQQISPFLDANQGYTLAGEISEITGGQSKTMGCNIKIWIEPEESDHIPDKIKRYHIALDIMSKQQYAPQNTITYKHKKSIAVHIYKTISIIIFIITGICILFSIALLTQHEWSGGITFSILAVIMLIIGINLIKTAKRSNKK